MICVYIDNELRLSPRLNEDTMTGDRASSPLRFSVHVFHHVSSRTPEQSDLRVSALTPRELKYLSNELCSFVQHWSMFYRHRNNTSPLIKETNTRFETGNLHKLKIQNAIVGQRRGPIKLTKYYVVTNPRFCCITGYGSI